MKFRLIESLHGIFTEVEELEYYASDVVMDEDQSKVSGSVHVKISADDILDALWDFLCEDKHPILTEDEMQRFSEDDVAWEKYVKDNYDMLWDRYEDEFYNKFIERASDKVYDNWDNYTNDNDESPYSQRDEDIRNFWRDVWGR